MGGRVEHDRRALRPAPAGWVPVTLSYDRASTSMFRDLADDLAAALPAARQVSSAPVDARHGPPDHSPTNEPGGQRMPDGGEACGTDLLEGYDVGAQAGFLLRRAHQRHAALFQDMFAAAGFDLTPTQFNALVRVTELGAVSQNQLGRLAAMDPATIQGVVRRLHERGLVHRRTDPNDRRASILAPTAAGSAMAATAAATAREVTAATLAPLSAAEQRTFLRLLAKLS